MNKRVWVWALLIAISLLTIPQLNSHLTTTLRIPQSPSDRAQELLSREFGENIEGTFTVIYRFKSATKSEISDFSHIVSEAALQIPGSRMEISRALGGYFFALIQTPMNLTQASEYTQQLRAYLREHGMSGSLVGGPPAIKHDVTPVLNQDLLRGELIGLFCAIVLLISLIGFSRTLLIPLLFALAVTSLSLALVYLYSLVHPMSLYLPNIVALIALGLSIDYSLLLIYRYRSARSRGLGHDDAILETRNTASKTVVISASLVALSLMVGLVIDIPFIRSITLGALFIPLMSLVVTTELAPSLLARYADNSSRGWLSQGQQKWARSISQRALRYPKGALVLSLALLTPLVIVSTSISLTPSSLTTLPKGLESEQALSLVTSRLGEGVITPHILLVQADITDQSQEKLESYLQRLKGVLATSSERSGRNLKIYVITLHRLGSQADRSFVEDLRNLNLANFGIAGGALYLAGAPAQGYDLLSSIESRIGWIVGVIAILFFFVLRKYFSSNVLAIKALVMGGFSLIAVIGALVLATRYGIGTYALDQIEAWALLLTLTILFGLSIDYELFIVSRIREAHDRGLNDVDAISEGLEETSIVVTAAGLILISALTGFIFGHFPGVQQLGLGLLIGIFLDITLIRLLLLPATMALLGRWNWR